MAGDVAAAPESYGLESNDVALVLTLDCAVLLSTTDQNGVPEGPVWVCIIPFPHFRLSYPPPWSAMLPGSAQPSPIGRALRSPKPWKAFRNLGK